MKNLLSLLIIFSIGFVLKAQTTGQVASYTVNADGGVSDALYKHALGSLDDAKQKSQKLDKNIEGSPYTSNLFSPTTVYYGDEPAGKLYYRYNAHNQEIEIKQQNSESEPIRALGRDKKIKIIIDGKPMSFKTFVDKNGKTQNGYLTLVKDGKFKLYKRINIIFKEAKKAPNSLAKGTPARFTQFVEYYIESEGGNRVDQLELNNKKLLKLVNSDKHQALKKFIKDHKIKLNNEDSVSKIIDFLNS